MRVLISGGGIAGPTLAWFLARAGIDVTIVERSARMFAQGQNIDIDGAALTALKKMNLFEKVKENNTTEVGTRFVDENEKVIATFPQGKGRPSPTSEFEILRGDLAMVLYNATKDDPRIKYLLDTTIDKIISNDEKSVKVELSNGNVEEYDVLVGADGQWSNVRKLAYDSKTVTLVDKDQYVAYFTIPKNEEDTQWWDICTLTKSRVGSQRPDSHGTTRVCLIIMPLSNEQRKEWQHATRAGRKTQNDLIQREFADAGWRTSRFLKDMVDAEDFYLQAIQQVKMEKWTNNRITCVGDAAYAPTALTGQGTTIAITGAYVLAGELSKLKEGENPTKALQAYEDLYHPHTDKVQYVPSFVPGIVHPNSNWKRKLLQTAVWAVSKAVEVPFIARQFGDADYEKDDQGFPLPSYPTLDSRLNV